MLLLRVRTNEWTGGFTLTLRVDLILPRKMIHTVTQPSYPIKDVSTIFQKLENYNLLCFADTSPLCFVVDLYHLTWRLSNGYPRNFERQSEKGSTVPPTRFRTKPENSCYTSKYQTHKRRVKLVKEKHKMIKYIHPKLRYRQNLLKYIYRERETKSELWINLILLNLLSKSFIVELVPISFPK